MILRFIFRVLASTSLWIALSVSGASAGDLIVSDPGVSPPGWDNPHKVKCPDHDGTVEVKVKVNFTVPGQKGVPGQPDTPDTNYTDGISLKYTGKNCKDCKWVQFHWAQDIWQPDSATPYYVFPGGISGTSRPLLYTPGPKNTPGPYTPETPQNPTWGVDAHKDSPDEWYESMGANVRTPDSTTIFDRPGPIDSDKRPPANVPAKFVHHFAAYLICSKKVCAKVTYTVTYTWSGKESDPVFVVDPPTDASDLDPKQRKLLKKIVVDPVAAPARPLNSGGTASEHSSLPPCDDGDNVAIRIESDETELAADEHEESSAEGEALTTLQAKDAALRDELTALNALEACPSAPHNASDDGPPITIGIGIGIGGGGDHHDRDHHHDHDRPSGPDHSSEPTPAPRDDDRPVSSPHD